MLYYKLLRHPRILKRKSKYMKIWRRKCHLIRGRGCSMAKNKNSLVVITLEQHLTFTLEEISHAANVSSEFILDLIAYGIIEPGGNITHLQFNADHLRRARQAIRLQ